MSKSLARWVRGFSRDFQTSIRRHPILIIYRHDVTSQRTEKKVNGYFTRYVYDSEQVIVEYDANNNLLRGWKKTEEKAKLI